MKVQLSYQAVIKYKIKAATTQPFHIGSAENDKEEVLIHPADGVPFIQASSIAGVFRQYWMSKDPEKAEKIFGMKQQGENTEDYSSRLRISDGIFEKNGLTMELRPRLHINPESGTCDSNVIKGTQKDAGHKFNMQYIGAGAEFYFDVYLYDMALEKELEEIFAAIQAGSIQLGGQKSNGCGYFRLEQLFYKKFDLTNPADRQKWADEDTLEEKEYKDKISELEAETVKKEYYEIIVKAKTEGDLLVKSIAVASAGEKSPDCMNIRNAQGNYIVPGSSMKGAIRSQMEKIAAYLHKEDIIEDSFGIKKENNAEGKIGNMQFFDTVVGDKIKNDRAEASYRIHIDKFTGGVMHGSLFSEKNISGNMEIRIFIQNKNHPERTCGLLCMALRDLAIGTMNIGSGYSVGKGILAVSEIELFDYIHGDKKKKARMDFEKNEITDDNHILTDCWKAVKEGQNQNALYE